MYVCMYIHPKPYTPKRTVTRFGQGTTTSKSVVVLVVLEELVVVVVDVVELVVVEPLSSLFLRMGLGF